jgi:Fe-S-cluster containining protein
VDKLFETVKAKHPDEVTCAQGCSDCCHAIFDLSLIEALYLHAKARETLERDELQKLFDRANEAERQQARVARTATKRVREGVDDQAILEDVATARIRCPLLDEEDSCQLYEHRPLTCRLYGIPQAIRGEARTCGLSGFDAGQEYPTVRLEMLQDALVVLSREAAEAVNSKLPSLGTTHMPLGTALLTTFDGEYLGVKGELEDDSEAPSPFASMTAANDCGCGGAEGGCTNTECGSCADGEAGPDGCPGSPTIIEFGGHEK